MIDEKVWFEIGKLKGTLISYEENIKGLKKELESLRDRVTELKVQNEASNERS